MNIKSIKFINYFSHGRKNINASSYIHGTAETKLELDKTTSRTQVINYLLSNIRRKTTYLEIGVRNPEHNFNHISSDKKYSVDPGAEYKDNPVDYKMTSDEFFRLLDTDEILSNTMKFDLVFIDGLHLAGQVNRDIENSLRYIADDGFVVLHDCNPPTEWHAREDYRYQSTPAGGFWNGTTWKAFLKWRSESNVQSCCIDSDWGIGIISKTHPLGDSIQATNPFFEFSELDKNRARELNLISFEKLKLLLNGT